MQNYLEFEKPLAEIEGKAVELRALAKTSEGMDVEKEAAALDEKATSLLVNLYENLTPWRKCQVARHPNRPHCRPVVVLGQEKGFDTKSRIERNFGMARPEGYRKAIRLMDLADRFNLPVITLVDTPGAYPGKGAEERGQSEAIARSTEKCLQIGVPLISVIIGEGGSGGALAISIGDHLSMLEYATYSVASPEACASIIWRTPDKAPEAANAMKVCASELKKINVIDEVISEPVGGAHRDFDIVSANIKASLVNNLTILSKYSMDDLLQRRYKRLLDIGA